VGVVDQAARSTLNIDRLKSGVTLRQTKISDCMGGFQASVKSNSDSDDDDDFDDDDDSDDNYREVSCTE